jgi:hypothetical protein
MFLRNVGMYLQVCTALQSKTNTDMFTAVRTSNLVIYNLSYLKSVRGPQFEECLLTLSALAVPFIFLMTPI